MDLRNPLIKPGPVADRNIFIQARDEIILRLLYRTLKKHVKKEPAQVVLTGTFDTGLLEFLSLNLPLVQFAYAGTGQGEGESSFQQLPAITNLSVYKSFEEADRKLKWPADILMVHNLHRLPDDIGFLKWIQTFDLFSAETVVLVTAAARKRQVRVRGAIYPVPMLKHYCNRAALEVLSCAYFLSNLLPFRPLPGSHKAGKGSLKQIILEVVKFLLKVDFRVSLLLNRMGIRGAGWYTYATAKKYSENLNTER